MVELPAFTIDLDYVDGHILGGRIWSYREEESKNTLYVVIGLYAYGIDPNAIDDIEMWVHEFTESFVEYMCIMLLGLKEFISYSWTIYYMYDRRIFESSICHIMAAFVTSALVENNDSTISEIDLDDYFKMLRRWSYYTRKRIADAFVKSIAIWSENK